MGFYIRKAFTAGPFRFNLSQWGVGVSVGGKGARLGIRPNGQLYGHAGRYGLYWRENFTKAPSKRKSARIVATVEEAPPTWEETKDDLRGLARILFTKDNLIVLVVAATVALMGGLVYLLFNA